MIKILISDTHYGVKQNSLTWLKYQTDFIYKQLIPFIKEQTDDVVLYHLGDVFDSRSSINPYIASKIRDSFKDLSRIVDDFIIIGGNHDYYSPNDAEVNSLDMVLRDIEGIKLITNELYVKNEDLFVPWYEYENVEKLRKTISLYNIKNIYCHSDLTHLDGEYKELFKGVNVYSGHIHTPNLYKNLHTLGSTYALTFADCNQDRGFYTIKDNSFEFHPNTFSIRFWRFRNDEIFNCIEKVGKDDYIELYVDQINLLNDTYLDEIKKITKHSHNTNIIPVSQVMESEESCDFENYNIEEICRENIPEELQDKFNVILEKNQ